MVFLVAANLLYNFPSAPLTQGSQAETVGTSDFLQNFTGVFTQYDIWYTFIGFILFTYTFVCLTFTMFLEEFGIGAPG